MPSLTREQFGAVVEYVNAHREELVDEDRAVEERIARDIAAQSANGLRHQIDESLAVEERAARLKEKIRRRLQDQAERNGGKAAR